MITAILNFLFAIFTLALLSEVHSTPLVVIGWMMAVWFAVLGALSGWMTARG